jgi:hypothetical protein
MPDLITDSNRELGERITRIENMLAELLSAWRRYEPVIGAYQRGGLLAARTARKQNGHAVHQDNP